MKIVSYDWVIKYLKDRGFEVVLNFTSDRVKHWVLKWQGEQVGSMFNDDIYLRKNLPSLLPFVEGPTRILFDNEDADDVLRKVVYDLLDSPRRFDDNKRKERVDKVKKYFDERKCAKLREEQYMRIIEEKLDFYENRSWETA